MVLCTSSKVFTYKILIVSTNHAECFLLNVRILASFLDDFFLVEVQFALRESRIAYSPDAGVTVP